MRANKFIVSIVLLVAMLMLTACEKREDSAEVDKDNVRSEDDIAIYLTALFEEKYSTSFEFSLKSKEPMQRSKYSMVDGTPISTYEVTDAYEYNYEMVDPDGVTAGIRYLDPIIVKDGAERYRQAEKYIEVGNIYIEARTYYEREIDIRAILKKSDMLWKMEDEAFCIFIFTDDAHKLGDIIREIDKCFLEGSYGQYQLYITKDKGLFDELNQAAVSDLHPGVGANITLMNTSYSATFINRYDDYSVNVLLQEYGDFGSILFRYEAETNSIISGWKHFTVFGLQEIS